MRDLRMTKLFNLEDQIQFGQEQIWPRKAGILGKSKKDSPFPLFAPA